MRRNLDLTRGLVFSGQLLLDLAAAGMLREQAYRVVQAHAMRAWEEEGDFRAAIEGDPEVRAVLSPSRSPRRSRWSGSCGTSTRSSRGYSGKSGAAGGSGRTLRAGAGIPKRWDGLFRTYRYCVSC